MIMKKKKMKEKSSTAKGKDKLGSSNSNKSTKKFIEEIRSLFNESYMKVYSPKTNQQVMSMMFKDIEDNIMRISDDIYSICFEYTDISFSKADVEDAATIFLKWVDFLNSFSEATHIQINNASTPVNTEKYKEQFIIKNNKSSNEKKIADEFNQLISDTIGKKRNTLLTKKYITISQKALNFDDARAIFFNIYRRIEEKFKDIKSNVRIVPMNERLTLIHDFWNVKTADEKRIKNFLDYSKENGITIYDALAPKEYINMRGSDYIEITSEDMINTDNEEAGHHKKRFIRCMYIEPDFPNAITPKFYNELTSLEDIQMVTTINIQPTETTKSLKKMTKLQSGLETERYNKIKSLAKNQVNYEFMKDKKLESRINDVTQMIEDIQYNDQRIFCENIVLCLVADSYAELEEQTVKIQNKVGESLINVLPIKWQQLEGIQNTLPLGFNTLQFQHRETSEATAVHVPFNSKDFLHPYSIFHGRNLVSRNPVFLNRKGLMNGNGCILATSGAGKSFQVKMIIEQIMLRYADDEVIVIDFQKEYQALVDWFGGQTIKLSDSTNTYINPLDLDQNYSLSEDDGIDSPVKAKIEYMQGWVESIIDEGALSAIQKTLVDRCVKNIFVEYERSNFRDKTKQPLLKDFQKELALQPEKEAKQMAKALERFVTGSQDIFSHETNVNIHDRLINFDISSLPTSIQTSGYLIVLDHIMNRLAHNREKGINTWIFIDEFHILLSNPSGAEYIAKIVKIGRKFNALITVITQNISDVLKNKHGEKILGNSEFAIILKQKATDRSMICNIFDISQAESKFIGNDAKHGQGIIVYGDDKIPFYNPVPEEFILYKLNNTDNIRKSRT